MSFIINDNLKKTAFSDPTKETIQKSIGQLCKEIDSNQIIMPIFQRDLGVGY